MQPTASVVACVYNYGFFIAATSEQFAVYFTETLAVHTSDVYVAYTTVRQLIHILTAAFYPAFVKQIALFATTDGFDGHVKSFSIGRIIHGKQYLSTGFTFQ